MAEHGQTLTEGGFGAARTPSVDILEFLKKRENAGRPGVSTHWRLEASDLFVHPTKCSCGIPGLFFVTSCATRMGTPWQRQSFAEPTCGFGTTCHCASRWSSQGRWGNGGRGTGSTEVSHSAQEAFEVFLHPGGAREVGQARQVKLQRDLVEKVEPDSPSLSDTVSLSGECEFPPAHASAPGRKVHRRGRSPGSKVWARTRMKSTERAECEGDKFAKSAVETVRSRLS